MRYRSLFLIALSTLAVSGVSHASYNCQEKQYHLQREIDYATQHGNHHRVIGLQHALEEVRRHCSDGYIQARHQHKIAEKQLKVQRRQDELTQAEQSGNKKKIAKYQKKLRKAQAELQKAEQEHY